MAVGPDSGCTLLPESPHNGGLSTTFTNAFIDFDVVHFLKEEEGCCWKPFLCSRAQHGNVLVGYHGTQQGGVLLLASGSIQLAMECHLFIYLFISCGSAHHTAQKGPQSYARARRGSVRLNYQEHDLFI